jgi:hypothetical protein
MIIQKPTVPLQQLFSISAGLSLETGAQPIAHVAPESNAYPLWKHNWRASGSLWADPRRIPSGERFVLDTQLRRNPTNKDVLSSHKILATRSTNRGSFEPFAAYLDITGLSPTNNMFCIVPRSSITEVNEIFAAKLWSELSDNERLLWLLGILNSELAIDILMPERDARRIDKDNWLNFPLPTTIDRKIITIVDDIIRREQRDAPDAEIAPLRRRLNAVVEAAYGHPVRPLSLVRTGELPDAPQWQAERKEKPMSVTGQVLDVDAEKNQVLLSLAGLVDDEPEAWVPLPPELPGWALDGTVFSADISATVETFAMLRARPWALRNVKHTPRPYLSLSDLQAKLTASIEGTA